MKRSVDLLLRVFLPLVGLPHGVTGCRPPEVRPSPPPCGWSIGFIVTPRLCGRRPSQRERPAWRSWCSCDRDSTPSRWWQSTAHAPGAARPSSSAGSRNLDRGPRFARKSRRSGDGPALADFHLDIMDDGADRNIGRWHRIARLHVDLLAGDHFVADGEVAAGREYRTARHPHSGSAR